VVLAAPDDLAEVVREGLGRYRPELSVERVESASMLSGIDGTVRAAVVCLGPGEIPRRVHDIAARVGVPLVVVSDSDDPELARQALAAGAHDYVVMSSNLGREVSLAVARAEGRKYQGRRLQEKHQELQESLRRAQEELGRLRSTAVTDWLTGLFNKRFLEERLTEEENKASRTGVPVSLLLLDLDHFKVVNDTWGHQVGDVVLRGVARVIQRCLRSYDVPCRYGGEEFAVILPGTPLSRAAHVAERIREELSLQPFEAGGERLTVTGSAGVAEMPSPMASTQDELMRAADRALYHAKATGRNRVVVAGASSYEPAMGLDLATSEDDATRLAFERVAQLRASITNLTRDTSEGYVRSVAALVQLAEEDEGRVFGSSERVAELAVKFGRTLGLDPPARERVRRAALFQELGMIAIAPIVRHAGELSDERRALVRQHPALSVRIADSIAFLEEERTYILHHHERFDGTGYPRGLRGDSIPLGSRILGVAMAYEAMTSARPYRESMSPEAAIAELQRLSGSWYDPDVVRAAVDTLADNGAG
jgi:diguanylate cyclase (GGDEF)-like protein